VVIVWAHGIVIFMLNCGHSFGYEHVAYMSIHGFGVFDLGYHYRSISTNFQFDGFISDVSRFRYRYRFQVYHFRIVSE
jgi:hypothetical protein